MKSSSRKADHRWRFLANHPHVLEYIAANPTARLRDIAKRLEHRTEGCAEIVNDLERAGYLTKTRDARRNLTKYMTSFRFAIPGTATTGLAI